MSSRSQTARAAVRLASGSRSIIHHVAFVIERTPSAPLARVYTAGAERPAKARSFGGAPGRREVPIHKNHAFTGDRPPVGGRRGERVRTYRRLEASQRA